MEAPLRTVDVRLGERAYTIEIGTGCARQIATFCTRQTSYAHAVIITDDHVGPLYSDTMVDDFDRHEIRTDVLAVPAGEKSKSTSTVAWLWQQMLERGTDRKSLVVAAGGGVVGDLAGFAAATYARGLSLIQVPTTLLAQVDSSVGGKVGINLPEAKNIVGAFWQPRGVLVDIALLGSLPERQYRSGLAEVVKYGVILDADFFAYLEEHVEQIRARDPHVLVPIVARCCQLKADIVERDEQETSGLRAILNYGHTFCHALEALTGYEELLHGEAVAIGMVCASRLAERLGRIAKDTTERQKALLTALGLPTQPPAVAPQALLSAMRHDKKAVGGKLRFVLPARLGHVELVGDVEDSDVTAALG